MSKEIAQTVSGPKIAWLLAIVAAFAVLATLGTQWQKSEAASSSDQAPLVQNVAVDAAVPGGGDSLFSDSAIFAFSRPQDTLVGSLSLDSILNPQGEGRNGAAATFAQAVWDIATGKNLGESATGISSAVIGDDSYSHESKGGHIEQPAQGVNLPELGAGKIDLLNGQTVEVLQPGAAELRQELVSKFEFMGTNATTSFDPDSLEYGADIAGVFNPSGTFNDYNHPQANPWNANILHSGGLSGWVLFHERTGSGEVIASSADSAGLADGLVPNVGVYAQESTGDSQDTAPAASSEVKSSALAEGGAFANWLFAALGIGAIVFGVGGVTSANAPCKGGDEVTKVLKLLGGGWLA